MSVFMTVILQMCSADHHNGLSIFRSYLESGNSTNFRQFKRSYSMKYDGERIITWNVGFGVNGPSNDHNRGATDMTTLHRSGMNKTASRVSFKRHEDKAEGRALRF